MVLVFAENVNGTFKKAAHEVVTYGKKTAERLGTDCVALVLGEADDAGSLGTYGADRVVQVKHANLADFDAQVYTAAISEAAKQIGGQD